MRRGLNRGRFVKHYIGAGLVNVPQVITLRRVNRKAHGVET